MTSSVLRLMVYSTLFSIPVFAQVNPPVYAPPGQIINGFPLELILDSTPVVTSSYSITYSLNLIQYTVSWNSSGSVISLYNTYKQYLPANGWTIANDIATSLTFRGLYATKGSSVFLITIGFGINNGQQGTQVSASYGTGNPPPGSSCQMNVTKLYQAVNASGVVQPWACDIYNHAYGTQSSRYCAASPTQFRIAQMGCALTGLTMSLNAVGLSLDPGTLNSFMLQPQHAYDFGPDHGVSFDTTVNDVASSYGKTLNWTWFTGTSVQDLRNTLCSADVPIIVGVDLTVNQANQPIPGHYVLVTGWDGTQFQIADPGFPDKTSLLAYGNQFIGAGYVTDPQSARSSMHLSVADAELLATDPNGLKSGFDVTTSQNLNQIPGSAYSRSGLVNDETGEPSAQAGYYLDIHQPAAGTYTINVQGLKLEPYNLTVRVFDANGDPEPPLSVVGIEAPGSSQTLSIQYLTSIDAPSTVGASATFHSTLADIHNSLTLGLIDNAGIANSLSQKIQAAQVAAGPARSNILNAFKGAVTAQSGKHITGIAPQLLLQDADSLLNKDQ